MIYHTVQNHGGLKYVVIIRKSKDREILALRLDTNSKISEEHVGIPL